MLIGWMELERGEDVEIGPVVEKNSRPENVAIGGKILAGGGGEVANWSRAADCVVLFK